MRTSVASGFTIVEVLVAILVLAFGLIGAAAMQLAALRARHQSTLLSNAVALASGMADKMRANAGQMRRDDPDNPYINVDYDAALEAAPAALPQQCFSGLSCNSEQLASFDLYELKQQIRSGLPGARLVICRDENRWERAGRGLNWDCSGAGAAPVVIKLGWRGRNPDGTPAQQAGPAVAVTLTGTAR